MTPDTMTMSMFIFMILLMTTPKILPRFSARAQADLHYQERKFHHLEALQ